MSGRDLIEALKATGTGESKLAPAEAMVERTPSATAEDVIMLLAANPRDVGALTVEKARRLASGASVKDFLGRPPKNAEESKLRTLGQEIGLAIADQIHAGQSRADELGVGIPSISRKK